MRIRPIQQLLPDEQSDRQGIFVVLGLVCLVACLSFVAFAIDLGYLNLTKSRMQNAVDAAALAAAQEIVAAVEDAPADLTGTDVTDYARDAAKTMAANVASLNDVYVDPTTDITFGKRSYNAATDTYSIEWGVSPSNCVKVTARRENTNTAAQDGQLPLFFAGTFGNKYCNVRAEAIAYVESRDIVIAHDFSRSMNFDSYYNEEANTRLTRNQIANYALTVWDDLALPTSKVGNLPRIPAYLKLTQTNSGTTTNVEFKYHKAVVDSTKPITKVLLTYTDNSTSTWDNLNTSAITCTGTKNINNVKVWTQSAGAEDWSDSEYGITVTMTNGRKNVSVSSLYEKVIDLTIYFTDGTNTFVTMPSNSYTGSYSGTKEIDKIKTHTRNGSSNYYDWWDPPTSTNVTQSQIFYDTDANVMTAFGLDNVTWPYASGSWSGYLSHCRNYGELDDDDGDDQDTEFRERFGGITFVNYLLRNCSSYSQCNDIWKTRHYPFHAIKEGHDLMCDFLQGLGFDDQIGMVSYDTYHRAETSMSVWDATLGSQVTVDISADPISTNYSAVSNLMHYKQAAHYAYATNMGGGLSDAITLLDNYKRAGARSTILLMTDGNTNTTDSGVDTSLPADWNWDELLDYDGNGVKDYYTTNTQKHYVLKLAKAAKDKDYTVHTMCVGADGDTELLEAIAFLTDGHYINVPGGSSVSEMEEEVETAFHKIATMVPPARLLNTQ